MSLVFIGYSARVKHSEYAKTWRVPDDDEADWPSPDQIYFDLRESLDGIPFECYGTVQAAMPVVLLILLA